MRPVPLELLAGDAPSVAPLLLGKVLAHGSTSGRIIEVEAYTGDDPASHSHRGETARNATMFGPPGHLYCYLSHGLHVCGNVVVGLEGDGQAVLVRAVEPIAGIEIMRERRHGRAAIADGPGKLCQALDIRLDHDGCDLALGPVLLLDDGTPPPVDPIVGRRVGISRAIERPWRWRSP